MCPVATLPKEGVITWRSGISFGGSSRGYCRRSDPQIWRSKMRICALQKRKETRRARHLNIQEQNIPSVQMISLTIRDQANASATKEIRRAAWRERARQYV